MFLILNLYYCIYISVEAYQEMESLYNKYEYIQLLLNKYRKYILYENENFYDYDKFSQTLQVEQYIKHICLCPKKNCMIYIYIFNDNS